jgi:Reverse transcriptase (RNA-dependent DNA polymerase)
MPFGLKNAPCVFQPFMDWVLSDVKGIYVFVYLDDIIVCSNSYENHVVDVSGVLKRLREFNLHGSRDKCKFFMSKVRYLGDVVGDNSLECCDSVSSRIQSWKRLVSTKELHQFLGFANFAQRLVINFSEKSATLNGLLRGNPRYVPWTIKGVEAFEALCSSFGETKKISPQIVDRDLYLLTDASGKGLGAELVQFSKDVVKWEDIPSVGTSKSKDFVVLVCILGFSAHRELLKHNREGVVRSC